MGRKSGIALVGLGAFLIVLAPLLAFYAYDKLAVVPLDQETTSISYGPGATIFSIAEGEEGVLEGHTPFMTTMKDGALRIYKTEGASPEEIMVRGGFAEVAPGGLTVLAEHVDA